MEGYNMLEVQKRNGDIVPFDKEKIIDAVNRAMIEVDKILYEQILQKILLLKLKKWLNALRQLFL